VRPTRFALVLGLNLEQVRQEVRNLLGEGPVGAGEQAGAGMPSPTSEVSSFSVTASADDGFQQRPSGQHFAKVAIVQIVYAAAMAGILGLFADSWLVLLVAFLIVLTSVNLPIIVKHLLSYQR